MTSLPDPTNPTNPSQPEPTPGPACPNPLATAIQQPRKDLTKASVCIFGPPKIGKTTLAAQWPGVWFWATEAGQTWVPNIHTPSLITGWDKAPSADGLEWGFLDLCSYVEINRPTTFADGSPLRTIVVDTVDLLYRICLNHVCQAHGMSHPSDLDWGRGWDMVGSEWQRVIAKMSLWPYGLIFVSHSRTAKIKSAATEIDKISPAISGAGFKAIHALVDIILYCCMEEAAETDAEGEITGNIVEQRMIICQPKNNIVAGDRTGCLPPKVKMDYRELLKLFPDTPKE